MSIRAKITSADKPLASSTEQMVDKAVTIKAGDQIALAVSPDQVSGYTRQGSDLIVQLKSGETIRIANFYALPDQPSHLFLVDQKGELVAAELSASEYDGALAAQYVPQGAAAEFSGMTTRAGIVESGGGIGIGGIAGGVAALAGGAAAAGGGGGGGGGSTPTPAPTTDTTPPSMASNLSINAAGTQLTGAGEAGATVRVDWNGDGVIDATATVGSNGQFTVPLNPPLTNGETVTVTVRDAAGNDSPAATVEAPDSTAPAPATDVAVAADGTAVTGSAEPGSTVSVDTDGDGLPDATATAGSDGRFTIALTPPLIDGETVSVVVTDDAGNASTPVTATAPDLNPLPDAPTIDPSNGTILTGSAELGTTVTLSDSAGNALGQATVDANGQWSFTPVNPLPDGLVVQARAIDAVGNVSAPAAVTIDAVSPAAPVIDPSNGTVLTGDAEAGATITLTDGSGNPIGSATADAQGNWTLTPVSPLADGTIVTATATDAAGNVSPGATVTIDAIAPPAPVIAPSNGVTLVGTAEAGTTITLSANSATIGTAQVDVNGNWTFHPATPIADDTVVSATATDPSGNVSPSASVTIDTSLPSIPTIDPSNGTVITGEADAGNIVTVTDGAGNPIGTATVDGNGNWSVTPASPLADGTVIRAVAENSNGVDSAAATGIVDAVAPAAPTIDPTDGDLLGGTAEAGALITLTDGSGNPIGQATADANGDWSFTPGSPLPDGLVVNATATDAAGNVSGQASTTVDDVAPAAPVINPSNGVTITGTAEANSTVVVSGSGGVVLGTATVLANGNWAFAPSPALANGAVVSVIARDAAGNDSPSASVTIDAVAPAAPVVSPTDGSPVTGTAEAGVTITIKEGSAVIGTATADGAGNWSFTPVSPLVNGSTLSVTATDGAGNVSPIANVTVDSLAPFPPTVELSDGTVLNGTAEIGATVTLTDGLGNPVGTTTADGNGDWTFTPGSPLPNGTVVSVIATDATGNASGPATVTIDSAAPAAPVLDASNGVILTGTAEANATVSLVDGGGNPIGTTVADANGDWSVIPATTLPNGTVVIATATDATGNDSLTATITVDSVAPAAPSILPSDGSPIAGTAEANATITLSNAAGTAIATVTADGSGNWSYIPGSPVANGTIVQATATDAAGNVSLPAAITIDSVAPATPTINPTDGSPVTGTAEAGATITLTDGLGALIDSVTADGSGNWTYTPGSPLLNGVVVNATATDAAGNVSGPVSTTVDSVAPIAPVIAATNGVNLVGTAEAGVSITLTDNLGSPIGQTTADGSGNWSFTPASPLPDTTIVNATATDAAGNVSLPGSVTVDASLPSIPVINPSNGAVVTGTADPGDTITLTDGFGLLIGVDVADGSGNWSITPFPLALPHGTVLNAVAENILGTDSAPATSVVDAIAPAAPTIDPSNGVDVSGTAEAGATVTLTDGGGTPIGTATADANGDWTFSPPAPLPNATVVNATATDPAGNVSPQASVTVDALPPGAPVIAPSNGAILSGTAEAGALVTLTTGGGTPLGQITADGSGNWALTPSPALTNGVVVNATATDGSGNVSPIGTTTIDTVAPGAPTNLVVAVDGSTLTGLAEPNAQVRVIVNGDVNNPVIATANGSGGFTVPFAPPLTAGQDLTVTAADAAGNVSLPAAAEAPDLAPLSLTITEAADGFVNAAEMSNGIQVSVGLTVGANVGDVLTVRFSGQNGYIADQTHVVTAGERASGIVNLTLTPPQGMGAYPQGASTVSASLDSGPVSPTVGLTVDTVAPSAPVLSLVGNLLTVSGEPNTDITVDIDLGGTTATATVQTDNSGLASLNLLTGLNIGLTWDQLLDASVSAYGEDAAGNPSNVATIGIGSGIDTVTVGNFGLNVGLIPPALGFSGTTEAGGGVRVEIVTPLATAIVNPPVDSSGHFNVNLLSASVLSQLGLSVTGLLNLGAGIGINLIATDANGNDSSQYGLTLAGAGLGLHIGQITLTGDNTANIMQGTDGSSEVINAGGGDDLILHVGTGDTVNAGDGNDTIEIAAHNFVSINGGNGFDTILFDNGIDIDYNGPGVGTWSNIERIDLGTGDSGSVLTLTASEVDAVTDTGNTLQITGEANDTLNISGAFDTGTTTTINGLVYDVYTFGTTTVLVEDNTVTVVH